MFKAIADFIGRMIHLGYENAKGDMSVQRHLSCVVLGVGKAISAQLLLLL